MNLKTTIRRILKEETEVPLYLRRRLDFDEMDRVFEKNLDIWETRMIRFERPGTMSLKSFKDFIIAGVMDSYTYLNIGIDNIDENQLLYDNIHKFLYRYYSERIEEVYNRFNDTIKQEQNESELTEKCWKGYTQKGMKTMFGKRYPNCVKKTKK
jgi:hypothetical protein